MEPSTELAVIDYRIEDNFLPVGDFHSIVELLLSKKFEWNHYHSDTDNELVFFSHYFYRNYGFQSKFADKIDAFMRILKPHSIVQIRTCLFNRTLNKVKEFEPQQNYKFKHKVMIYTVNDNDGYTLLPDGTKIQSKENRAIFIESDKPYVDSSCTNDVYRATIQFHYF